MQNRANYSDICRFWFEVVVESAMEDLNKGRFSLERGRFRACRTSTSDLPNSEVSYLRSSNN